MPKIQREDALNYHEFPRPGKIEDPMKHDRPIIALLLLSLMTVSVVGCTEGSAKLISAATADQAIEQTAQSVADGRFDTAWQALPPPQKGRPS